MKHKPTRFTQALCIVLAEEQWDRLPDAHLLKVYELQIRRLEAQIDALTGDRAGAPTRIDALAQKGNP